MTLALNCLNSIILLHLEDKDHEPRIIFIQSELGYIFLGKCLEKNLIPKLTLL